MLNSGSDIADDLEWVGRMSGLLLIKNNLLVDRSGNYLLRNASRADDKRMSYFVEPCNVPL